MAFKRLPEKQGLYDPQFEHDSCGVGFVCDIKGRKSHDIVAKGILALEHLMHRGATGSDPRTGDGAGILIQVPHEFLLKECSKAGFRLPKAGDYGIGLVFLPTDAKERKLCEDNFKKITEEEGLIFLGWREVPVDDSAIGKTAKESRPVIKQVFVGRPSGIAGELAFERKLYIVRKRAENFVRGSTIRQKASFYISGLSSRTLSYKGLLMSTQLKDFFPDLKDRALESSFTLFHARYSTNTFPAWDLSQPFRFLAHNGEINTLRGNINWMKARQGLIESGVFGKDIKRLFPVIVPGGSDSASLDNMLELLVLGGRSLPHAMMMLIPEAWQGNDQIGEERKRFYEYHACLMEPWDGPAAIAFTDGKFIGATLDRNGLRPARYVITKNGIVVMASEAGVLDIPPEEVAVNSRLQPGRMFLIDTHAGRIIGDEELKSSISNLKPYGRWLDENMEKLEDVPFPRSFKVWHEKDLAPALKAFGYSKEDLRRIIKPMAGDGNEPTGSMGDDTPLAVLSTRPRMLYDYFKQLFAQVTNPPIDPIREELVMTLNTYLGSEKNLLDETPTHCHRLKVNNPILSNMDIERIRHIRNGTFKAKTISTLFEAKKGKAAFKKSLDRICAEADKAVKSGCTFIILSDRGVDGKFAALPALLACGAVHHHLVRKETRTQASIIIESGEPREVAHFALLFGYGAGCINPYLAYETIEKMIREKDLVIAFPDPELAASSARKNYTDAVNHGLLKILSKMGISTLQSYRGAQIFEAVGLSGNLIERCFTGTVSRIEGIGLDEIAQEVIKRHGEAFPETESGPAHLPNGGLYQWRRDGEFHLWNPESIAALQDATRFEDPELYKKFAALINDQAKGLCTLRGLMKFKPGVKPVPLDEVEPASEIVKRFVTGAMSFGSISRGAHETMAIAMNRLGGKSNSGEGGEDPARYAPLPNGDSLRSATKQVASGRFGVTINYLTNADELQIKIAQGAKPGEGGQLPGHKVSPVIAKVRHSTPGVTLISPPPHHDIYSIEDLAQLIFDLKNANPRARISVKLVSEMGVGTIAAGVAKGHADMILISGGDGGTGASPLSSIKHAGLPWELGLSETHQTLVLNDLRSRVRLQTDGQMRTGRDVVIAALLGAEEYGFATAALINLGCVMLRHCHLNNCSVGVATQDEELGKRFAGKPEYLQRYFYFVAEEVRGIMAELGARKLDELIGRSELIELNTGILNWKAKSVDLSRILYKPQVPSYVGTRCAKKQDHGLDKVMDLKLIESAKPAIDNKDHVQADLSIKNTDRAVGAMLSGEIALRYGDKGLPDDTVHFKFTGTAGQSFGAFLARGVVFEVEGEANDYVGKGLSGGRIIVYPPKGSAFEAPENIIIGNTTFYGATSGEAYICGVAGERFCIRNSGIYAVIEGVGDHGCEYMTGGRVVILGKTGRNFAAGMSGGIAYVYDEDREFKARCNMGMVAFEALDGEDTATIQKLLSNHIRYTHSAKAKAVLDDFDNEIRHFIKVMPVEYKRALEGRLMRKDVLFEEVSDG
ncbi:MAG: glutamate synthase large subunit [Candidatus Omnitrophica bacterium]|nr:glutamate synthase large subunit [Candidatus Omnitrophota bacterium]